MIDNLQFSKDNLNVIISQNEKIETISLLQFIQLSQDKSQWTKEAFEKAGKELDNYLSSTKQTLMDIIVSGTNKPASFKKSNTKPKVKVVVKKESKKTEQKVKNGAAAVVVKQSKPAVQVELSDFEKFKLKFNKSIERKEKKKKEQRERIVKNLVSKSYAKKNPWINTLSQGSVSYATLHAEVLRIINNNKKNEMDYNSKSIYKELVKLMNEWKSNGRNENDFNFTKDDAKIYLTNVKYDSNKPTKELSELQKTVNGLRSLYGLIYAHPFESNTKLYNGMSYNKDNIKQYIFDKLSKNDFSDGITKEKVLRDFKNSTKNILHYKLIAKIIYNIDIVQEYFEKYKKILPQSILDTFSDEYQKSSGSYSFLTELPKEELETLVYKTYNDRVRIERWFYRYKTKKARDPSQKYVDKVNKSQQNKRAYYRRNFVEQFYEENKGKMSEQVAKYIEFYESIHGEATEQVLRNNSSLREIYRLKDILDIQAMNQKRKSWLTLPDSKIQAKLSKNGTRRITQEYIDDWREKQIIKIREVEKLLPDLIRESKSLYARNFAPELLTANAIDKKLIDDKEQIEQIKRAGERSYKKAKEFLQEEYKIALQKAISRANELLAKYKSQFPARSLVVPMPTKSINVSSLLKKSITATTMRPTGAQEIRGLQNCFVPDLSFKIILKNDAGESVQVKEDKYKELLEKLLQSDKTWKVATDSNGEILRVQNIKENKELPELKEDEHIYRRVKLKPLGIPPQFIQEGVVDNYYSCVLAAAFFQILVSNTPYDEDYRYIEKRVTVPLKRHKIYRYDVYALLLRKKIADSKNNANKQLSEGKGAIDKRVLGNIFEKERIRMNSEAVSKGILPDDAKVEERDIERMHYADEDRVREHWQLYYKGRVFSSGDTKRFPFSLFQKKADMNSIIEIASIFYEATKNSSIKNGNFSYQNDHPRWEQLEYGGYRKDSNIRFGAYYSHGVTKHHSYQAPMGFLRLTEALWNQLAENGKLTDAVVGFLDFNQNQLDVSNIESEIVQNLLKYDKGISKDEYSLKELVLARG